MSCVTNLFRRPLPKNKSEPTSQQINPQMEEISRRLEALAGLLTASADRSRRTNEMEGEQQEPEAARVIERFPQEEDPDLQVQTEHGNYLPFTRTSDRMLGLPNAVQQEYFFQEAEFQPDLIRPI